jgi:flagellar basal-body rod protein FlgG
MQTGYYAATGGMVAQFNRLDTIANNLANVNSAGYKKDSLITGDFLRMYKESRAELPIQNQTKEGAQFYNRSVARVPQIVEEFVDHSTGILEQTNNKFDAALNREGIFFAVETPQGIRLTRDGIFTTNGKGELVTKDGFKVLPSDYFTTGQGITFNTESPNVELDKNGQFLVNIPGTQNFVQDKKLMIVEPQNIKALKKEGNNLFIPDSADPMKPIAESGAVMQGYVEKSNVNAMSEMVALIEAQRMFDMYQKVMQTQMDDLNKEAIDKIAPFKG